MGFSIEYSCHTIINIKHEWRLSLQLMTNWSLTIVTTAMLVYIFTTIFATFYFEMAVKWSKLRIFEKFQFQLEHA